MKKREYEDHKSDFVIKQIRFQMIDNVSLKFLSLKKNFTQSQKLNISLKRQLLKIGSETNSALIAVSSLSQSCIQLKESLTQKQKQLVYSKQEQKRLALKVQKTQIKLKQYQNRVTKFREMLTHKQVKNETLKYKIQTLQDKIKKQKVKNFQQPNEINSNRQIGKSNRQTGKSKLNKKTNSTVPLDQIHQNKQYLCSSNVKVHCENSNQGFFQEKTPLMSKVSLNIMDELEQETLRSQIKINRLKIEKQEINRKKQLLKTKINKNQANIKEIQEFFISNSEIPKVYCITTLEEAQSTSKNIGSKMSQKTQSSSRVHPCFDNSGLIKTDLGTIPQKQDRIKNIAVSKTAKSIDLAKFPQKFDVSPIQNSLIKGLLCKITETTQNKNDLIDRIVEQTAIMQSISQINKKIESQIAQQSSKIFQVSIKGKKQVQRHRRSIN